MTTAAHDVVVVGGGNAGISLAARLRRDGCRDVAVVEPMTVHRYRPLLSYVGGGQARFEEVERPQERVTPPGVRWYAERVVAVDPGTRTITLGDGARLRGTDLVLCPGVTQDWDDVPGSREAVHAASGASNYVDERVEHTWELTRTLERGRAVFAVGDGPIPCAGAALKPLFLSADHWRRRGVLDRIDVTLVVPWPTIFGVDRVDRELQAAADRFGVDVRVATRVQRIDADARVLHLVGPDGVDELGYDMLHLVPRHQAPRWVAEHELADAVSGGMVAVDPGTLAHRHHARVWGLGDAADVRASRSGGALRKQVPVVAENIRRARTGRPLVTYDGYSTHPITVSQRELVLAEIDREGRLTPSVPAPDLVRPRVSTWAYDRFLQPQLYWHSILAGRVSR
jgi:sulfide:quinone oxidoreductase